MSKATAGATSLFSPQKGAQCCVICNDVSQAVHDLPGFKNLASSWSKLDIPKSVKEHVYMAAHDRVKTIESTGQEIHVHANCRTRFRNYFPRYSETYKRKTTVVDEDVEETAATTSTAKIRSQSQPIPSLQKQCFVCNSVRKSDGQPYDMGGLVLRTQHQTDGLAD